MILLVVLREDPSETPIQLALTIAKWWRMMKITRATKMMKMTATLEVQRVVFARHRSVPLAAG